MGVNASEVVTGTLWADIIKAGTLSDINNTSWFNLEDGTFSYGNGAITFDGESLDITIGGKSIEEIVSDTILTVIPSRESCIITLDEDLTPSKDTEYIFEFKVYKNNSTEEVPCVIKDVISSSQNVTTEWTNTTNTVKLKANTNTVFIDTEGSLEVTIETTIGDIKKAVYWNTIINTIEAPILSLSASSQMFVKQDMYSDFEPDSIDITAQCIRCEISYWKYSINNGKTFNLIESGTNDIIISSNKLNIKNTSNLFDENNYIIIRAESDSGVSDNITITRIEDTDTFNVQLSNENHTFIADSNGMAYAQKIAIDVYAFKGTENVSATVGLIENIPDGMTITINNNNSLNPSINIEVDESFDTISGIISVPVTISGVVIKKTFSYSLVKEGASGESASYVWALPTTLFFKEKGGETSPEEIKITSELSNCTFKDWSYSVGGEIWNTITTSNTGLTIDADYTLIITPSFSEFENSDSISFKITANSPTNVLCYDVITITKLKDGDDAFTVILDNESHTFIGNYDGYAIDSSINISPIGYVGVNRVPIKIGTITGEPTGMKSTITNNNTENPIIKITVNTTMTGRNGTITIPITATYNNITYNIDKIFSYSLSLDGTPASNVKIVGASNTFLSGDGGKTYTPSSLTFTGTYTECNYSKWQYLDTVANTWKDVISGALGLMITANKELIILNTSQLFSTYGGSVTFRLMTNVTGIYDMITVNKLTQVDNIGEELENIKSSITQTNNKWTAEFTLSNTSNLLFDGDFNLPTINYWNELNSDASMSLGTVNAYPFYENHQSLLTTFKYNNETGINYSLDLSLEPNTDYVYQAYIYTDNANLDTSDSLPLTYWTWVGDTPTSSETLDTSEIIDYSQIIEVGRYNLCYIHFKTKDLNSSIKCRLFIKGKTNKNDGNNARLSIRQVCFRQRSIPGRFEPNANEVKAGITTIDMNGISVEHTEANTSTQMTANGFFIVDSNGERIAELSSKEQWSQLKADYVFASNIENIYTGISDIYVDHSYVGDSDGSLSKPWSSFADLNNALKKTRIINKSVTITLLTTGDISEPLILSELKGDGQLNINLNAEAVFQGGTLREAGIRLANISLPKVIIRGASKFNQFIHGCYVTNCRYIDLQDSIYLTGSEGYGFIADNSNAKLHLLDFTDSYTAICARENSRIFVQSVSGNGHCFRVQTGGIIIYGNESNTAIPYGSELKEGGIIQKGGDGTVTPTKSWNYPNETTSIATVPSTMTYVSSFNATSKKSFNYSSNSWSDSDCKQGSWGYGLRGGHMFFDMTAIRSFLSGTVLDGNTITLTRANSGGISGGVNVYINGSSCSGASGVPSYGGQTLLGTLAWGETKTFTLPKGIVDGLKNGSYNSLAFYVNSTASNCYLNIVNANITLKTKK